MNNQNKQPHVTPKARQFSTSMTKPFTVDLAASCTCTCPHICLLETRL